MKESVNLQAMPESIFLTTSCVSFKPVYLMLSFLSPSGFSLPSTDSLHSKRENLGTRGLSDGKTYDDRTRNSSTSHKTD
jgi:hypothetical protein